MRARIAALWIIPIALVAAGFGAGWAAAVGAAERYSTMGSGPMVEPEIDWASMASSAASPLMMAGFAALLVTLCVHAVLWRAPAD